ncbi:TPA: phosphoribosylaminoimidazolesuccinocarboxamide synthase [Legionella pneumophila]|nr:phosphoribosylaminoimidazolesuccinocarboxamide synthase [Legionella pneumophila]HAT2065621.1 phosphoribosylaminoimidazolesuccinocarboxamide synthase [Legionella pneumophila]HCR5121033.1 phosphoribosylaminoimidazolesuccinocarboxamide synthase [Legionella pneumophila]HCR5124939.1 phosphoribosylaminoimidazolesuccinocarboxamide synthase [Legionella pneumophila]HCR5129508.1 phosphoribosylaminoimidazolesuccinocarboxamide synthase [Legionella pneumophila]HCR5132536.1 phosphoribosylaminoimidazolesu
MNTNVPSQEALLAALPFCLTETSLPFGKKYKGKVRDTYDLGDQLILVTTDRQSAFDRCLAAVPYKGQVLNLTSVWWFKNTQSIVPNHLIAVPDPNVAIAKKCKIFPVEFIVRGYISGSTSTSLWTQYQKGVREYCGITFPDGLRKNQKLESPVITPTTKETLHDRPISPHEIVAEGWMTQEDWDETSSYALKLFQHGMEVAQQHGLILVDTKYEFGRDAEGRIVLVDEIHTPDSSRYWLFNSYQERFDAGKEPENIDKEFLRLWYVDHCDPYKDEVLPQAPQELIVTLASRYIQLYEMITGESFVYDSNPGPVNDRILQNIQRWLG